MRNHLIPISAFCLSLAIADGRLSPTEGDRSLAITQGSTTPGTFDKESVQVSKEFHVAIPNAQSVYDAAGLKEQGLSVEAFTYAFNGYQHLIEKKILNRDEYLTICDMSQSSREKRMYVIDMEEEKLVIHTRVAHGRNSGAEFATRFSNRSESLQTSLGFYITQSTYMGGHGLSLKINGVDRGYNDLALKRNIVIHGAGYMDESWLRHSNYMGRSYGCPAVSQNDCNRVINTIKNGTCLFIYHPDKNYLQGSKILND